MIPKDAMSIVQRRLAALRRAAIEEVRDLNRLIFDVLRVGTVAGAFLLFAGLVLVAVAGSPPAVEPLPIGRALGDAFSLEPQGLLSLGVVLLVLTPVARVAASLGHFGRARDRAYVAITAIVLATLALSIVLGAG